MGKYELNDTNLEDGVPLVVVEDGDMFLSSRPTLSVKGGASAVSTCDQTWQLVNRIYKIHLLFHSSHEECCVS